MDTTYRRRGPMITETTNAFEITWPGGRVAVSGPGGPPCGMSGFELIGFRPKFHEIHISICGAQATLTALGKKYRDSAARRLAAFVGVSGRP
jgi:hypothetical protein